MASTGLARPVFRPDIPSRSALRSRLAPVLGSSSSSWVFLHPAPPRFGKRVAPPGPLWQADHPGSPGAPLAGGLCRATSVTPGTGRLWQAVRCSGLRPYERSVAVGSLGGAWSRSGVHMKVGVFAIVPDLVSPEKSNAVRFHAIRTVRAFHVTEQTSTIYPFAAFGQEESLPVGIHKSARSVRSVSPVRNSLADGVLEGGVPCDGTRSQVLARRAGAWGVIRAERALSTGRSVQGRRMDHKARVLPARGVVRFGVYTCPMTKMTSVLAVSAARVSAVGR
jgi:hypothetical protein